MSVGRQLVKTMVDTAADLRRYAVLVGEFDRTTETNTIGAEAIVLARRLEGLVPPVLAFEGEQLPQLTTGRS